MEKAGERRLEARVASEGTLIVSFEGRVIRGELGDISAGGALGSFKTAGGYPVLLETVIVEAQFMGMRVSGFEGLVIRLQAGEAVRGAENVKVAIKFDNMPTEKASELRSFATMFRGRQKEDAA